MSSVTQTHFLKDAGCHERIAYFVEVLPVYCPWISEHLESIPVPTVNTHVTTIKKKKKKFLREDELVKQLIKQLIKGKGNKPWQPKLTQGHTQCLCIKILAIGCRLSPALVLPRLKDSAPACITASFGGEMGRMHTPFKKPPGEMVGGLDQGPLCRVSGSYISSE